MPKQTVLNDNAEIYQIREEQTEKEKLREMPFKKRLAYLWTYYRLQAFIVLGSIALITYVVIDILNPDVKTQLYAAVINNTIETPVLDNLQKDFAGYLHLNPKRDNVLINSSFYLNSNNEYSMNMKQALSTFVVAQQIDVIIAPKDEFTEYTNNGLTCPLSDQLPTDLYSSLTDQFYMTSTEEKTEEAVYGIIISNTSLVKNFATYKNDNPYIIGIVANSKHKENAVEFIRYLFNHSVSK